MTNGNEQSQDIPRHDPVPAIVSFDVEQTLGLKAAYKAALEEGKGQMDSFTYDGKEYVVGFAKYMVEYLATEFRGRGLWPPR